MGVVTGGGGGGGSYTAPITRQQLSGSNVSIANNGLAALGWNSSGGPNTLLDRTDPTLPVIITAGVYSVVVDVQAAALTAGGFYEVSFDLNRSDEDAYLGSITSPAQTAAGRQVSVALGATWYLPAGADIRVAVLNLDGAATRNFLLNNAIVQRIS